MRSALRGPAHQLAVRTRAPMAIIIISQSTSQAPCAEGLHFSAFHYTCSECVYILNECTCTCTCMHACTLYMSHQAHQEQRTDEEALHGSEMKRQELLNRKQQLEEQRHV